MYPVNDASAQDTIVRKYRWTYGGLTWNWTLSVPASEYYAYKSITVDERSRQGSIMAGNETWWDFKMFVTWNDVYIREISSDLDRASKEKGFGYYESAEFVLSFVQSIPYVKHEMPYFPVETLVEGGACGDKSILYAAIMICLQYDIVFIYLTNTINHLAVGVFGRDLVGRTYYKYDGKQYYYCETTSPGWRLGYIPQDFRETPAYILRAFTATPISPQISSPPPTSYSVTMHVSGIPSSYSIEVYVDGIPARLVSGQASTTFTFELGSSHIISVTEYADQDVGARYHCPSYSWSCFGAGDYTFVYHTEYYLSVSSPYGQTSGEGWHDAGDKVSISVFPTTEPVSGIAGILGAKYVFDYWTFEDSPVLVHGGSAVILMDGPKSARAVWRTDYTIPFIIIAVVLGMMVCITVIALLTRKNKRTSPFSTTLRCIQCHKSCCGFN